MEKNNSILFQIKSLEKLVARYFLKQGKLNDLPKLTPTQIQIMDYFLENHKEEVFQRDLEKVLELRRATVSGVLQTMEKNELIKRLVDINDTRSKKIILNEKAKEAFEDMEENIRELEFLVTRDISKEELDAFSSVITKMKDNLSNVR